MGESHARVAVAVPPPPPLPWTTASVSPPLLQGGAGAAVTQWEASRSPTTSDTMLLACIATPIPGWMEDLRPTVEARNVALMHASAERVMGGPVEAWGEGSDFQLRRAGAPAGSPRAGIARAFLGWDDGVVVTGFAICAKSEADPATATATARGCDASVLSAHLEGSSAAPPPGIVLGTVTWGVHHPSTAAVYAGVLAFALATLAVGSRRRPRSRI